jgi:hypothetical protein
MSSWLFLLLLGIGIWLMTRERARWFFTAAGGLYLVLFVALLFIDTAQSGGGGLALTELLAGVTSLYFAECLVFLGLAFVSFKREKRQAQTRNPGGGTL